MDPRTFDGIIRQLSRTLSRRSLIGGSLGAAVLAAIGLGGDALAKNTRIKADRCIAAGRRCGTRKNDQPCRKCCHRYFIVNPKGKKKCACRPDGLDCTNASQCCTGNCENGFCRSALCQPAGAACTSPSQCCTGLCENTTCRSAPCRDVDASCDINTDCCSNVCGCVEFFPISICTCRGATCAEPDDPCVVDSDCCTEFCSTSFGEEPPGVCVPP